MKKTSMKFGVKSGAHNTRRLVTTAIRVRILAVGIVAWMVLTVASPFRAAAVNMRVVHDLPYVSGADPDARFHSLDLYLPEGKAGAPLIFFLHGGGLARGDKAYQGGFINFAEFFVKQGIGVASANYRLSPAVRHPAHTEDAAKALGWVHAHAADYQIDPGKILLAGNSAGGYLAALLALDKNYLAKESLSPQALRGVITISGVYDRQGGPDGGALPSAAQLVGSDKQTPPWLITFTDHDYYGMPEQAKRFYALMLKHGLPVEMAGIAERPHVGQIPGVGRALPRIPDAGADPDPQASLIADTLGPAILRFVDTVLRGQPMPNIQLKTPLPVLRTMKDVPYASGPGADPKLNALDLYLPEGKNNLPLVFFVHGGGWRASDKTSPDFHNFVETFAKIGVAVASTNYRLSPAVKHPAHIEDVAKAFAFVYQNAAQYGIDRNRILVAGTSAGGHLASLLALDPQYLRKQGLSPSVIKGVISLNGVYDVANNPEIGIIPSRTEQAFASMDRKLLDDASPIHHITPDAPPFLLFYAESDLFGIPAQNMSFYSALLRQGVKAQLGYAPGRTHFSTIGAMGQVLDQVEDVVAPTVVEFVGRVLAFVEPTERP